MAMMIGTPISTKSSRLLNEDVKFFLTNVFTYN